MENIQEIYNKKKLQLAITKAKTNKEDYELKVLERKLDIERIEKEIEKQEEQIKKCQEELAEFNKPKIEDKK